MSDINFVSRSATEKADGKVDFSQMDDKANAVKAAENQNDEEKVPELVTTQNSQRGYSLKDVELKFEVDQDANETTVYVLDKTSNSVLRTIPPEELSELDAGDLIEIAA